MKIRVNRRKVNYKKYRQPLSPRRRALGVAAIAVCSAIAAYLALLLIHGRTQLFDSNCSIQSDYSS